MSVVSAPALALPQSRDFTPPVEFSPGRVSLWEHLLDLLHRYSLGVFALLFLAVGTAATIVGGNYWSDQLLSRTKPAAALRAARPTIAGLNLTVPAGELQSKLQTITSQPASLTVGTQTVPVSPDTIRSWLQVTASRDKTEAYIRIRAGTITASLNQLANQFVKTPVNQVTVTAGGTSAVVVAGREGASLTNPGSLKTQANQVAKTVMDAKGLQFNTPLQAVPFQQITPANFDKLIVADISTKTMVAYQNGQIANSWLVSAGAPATPTPVGEYHIYAKYAVQDMRGFNPNGTPYFQPRVPYVNYFTGGDAIHGNYWRPTSFFGNINSSHGCVSVPPDEAAWIYNWAPVGTTVITTDNSALNLMNS